MPSAVREAIACRRCCAGTSRSRAAPRRRRRSISGSGVGAISRSLAKAGSAFCSAQNDGAHTSAAPTCRAAPRAARLRRTPSESGSSARLAGKRLQILDQPEVGAGADGRADRLRLRQVGERFPVRVGHRQHVGGAIIGPRHREPVRIGVRNQLEAEVARRRFRETPGRDCRGPRRPRSRRSRAPWAAAAAPARSPRRSCARPEGPDRAHRRSNGACCAVLAACRTSIRPERRASAPGPRRRRSRASWRGRMTDNANQMPRRPRSQVTGPWSLASRFRNRATSYVLAFVSAAVDRCSRPLAVSMQAGPPGRPTWSARHFAAQVPASRRAAQAMSIQLSRASNVRQREHPQHRAAIRILDLGRKLRHRAQCSPSRRRSRPRHIACR